jgi:hypothetical protein
MQELQEFWRHLDTDKIGRAPEMDLAKPLILGATIGAHKQVKENCEATPYVKLLVKPISAYLDTLTCEPTGVGQEMVRRHGRNANREHIGEVATNCKHKQCQGKSFAFSLAVLHCRVVSKLYNRLG